MSTPIPRLTVAEAIDRARVSVAGAAAGQRVILGITGPPGAGKSTLTARIVDAITGAVAVGMDGFHLAHSVLVATGEVSRKGAIQTFDGAGYVALLRRIRAGAGEPGIVWAPEFRREIEDAIAGAVAIHPETALVVTEGNYLLAAQGPWAQVRELVDEIWYVDVPDRVRLTRLVARHMSFGWDRDAAWARVTTGSDGVNAALVAATRDRADALVTSEPLVVPSVVG